MAKRVAIITARGGSKRIPRKNVKEFLGKPILLYSIEAALESGMFDEVMVSTEDAEIAQLAEKAGAKVPFFRSENTAGDYATTTDVIEEVLAAYKDRGMEFEYACCIYPTAPFVTADCLCEAMTTLEISGADSLIPVVRFSFPPQRAVIINDGKMQFKWPENMFARSQDLEPFYHDCGQFYCIKTESFLREKKLFMSDTLAYERPESEVQDIDTMEDWKLAELKYRMLMQKDR
ncbi:MAG: pseudaminic acid cytidylyltransferase [Lachnospiraceae bacterium]|nr:pseudaminic acid cytidylyltransferase [Lachnospiraceae bacterium]